MQVREGFKKMPLHLVGRNPLNPRTVFEGKAFDEMVESVRRKGVLTPVLVRPVPEGSREETDPKSPTHGLEVEYELVYGERRFRAACQVANENGGLREHWIPAMVRCLSDEDAFDALVLENLQREDLSPLEEARQFKAYIDRRGEHGAAELAERIGISPRYIRRRVAVLGLPEEVLQRWNEGDLLYGHLEQFLRLKDEAEILDQARHCAEWETSVADLRREIEGESPPLEWARFDLEQAGCTRCYHNTEVQKGLFGETASTEKALCLDPKCFRRHQNDWLNAHWSETEDAKRYKTNGWRFRDRISWNEYESFHDGRKKKPPEKCAECPSLVSLVDLDGHVMGSMYGRVCVGNKKCFSACMQEIQKADHPSAGEESDPGSNDSESSTGDEPQPRVAWHGAHYLRTFYDEQFVERFEGLAPDEAPTLRAVLFSLLLGRHDLREWWNKRWYGEENVYWLSAQAIWNKIETMDTDRLLAEIREVAFQNLKSAGADVERRLIAKQIGAKPQEHFRMSEEYLNKKTKAELLAIGEDPEVGVFETKEARAYLHEILNKKRLRWDTCKKPELVDVFLKSGVDLTGRVPAEIRSAEKEAAAEA